MQIQMREVQLKTIPLWGGHMRIDVPVGFIDVSSKRQIPETQELWTDADKDQSISLELLNKVEEPDDKAGKFHFDEIASANDATQTTFVEEGKIEVPPLAAKTSVSCVYYVGDQLISKLRDTSSQANNIRIYVVVFRLYNVETDLVLHYMSPLQLNANSQVKNVELESPDDVANKFRAIVSSFRLSDQWESLFQAEGH